jgi:cell division protease FtsH
MDPDSTVEKPGSWVDNKLVNRAFRIAFFPLFVIILLVYLAAQTVFSGQAGAERVEYGEFLTRVEANPMAVRKITFTPKTRSVEAEFRSGERLKTTYSSDASAFALERRMRSAGVRIDAKNAGSSAWWSILTYLAPFALFIAFWVFLLRRQQQRERERPSGLSDQSGGTSRY